MTTPDQYTDTTDSSYVQAVQFTNLPPNGVIDDILSWIRSNGTRAIPGFRLRTIEILSQDQAPISMPFGWWLVMSAPGVFATYRPDDFAARFTLIT